MSMVKRTISSLIALGVIACAANPISNAGAVDGAQLYKNAVEEASAQSSAAGAFYANTARGALYDIDGNGVDELILLYTIKTEQIPYLVSSVYTLSGGQIVTLLDEEPLYPLAGGPNGAVGVAQRDGQNMLYIQSESGETGIDAHRSGEWSFYQMAGNKMSEVESVSYEYVMSDPSDLANCSGSAVWDGSAISWEEYISRTSDITPEVKLTEDGSGSTLDALLDQIDNMMMVESPSPWAIEEVDAARDAGLIPSDLDSNYQTNITREEFCHLMSQLLATRTEKSVDELLSDAGIEPSEPYSDTRDEDILAMSALGIVNGVGNNRFDPNASITREEAAVMLARVAAKFDGLHTNSEPLVFSDQAQISSWAKEAVDVVSSCAYDGNRIMNGTGENIFSPKDTYTREQSIMTSLRLYQFIGDTDFTNSGRQIGSLLPYCYVGGYKLHYGEYKSVNFDGASIVLKADGTADYHMDLAPTTEYDSAILVQQDSVVWEVGVMDDYGTSFPAIWFDLEDTDESLYDGRQGYIVSSDDGFQNDWIALKYAE